MTAKRNKWEFRNQRVEEETGFIVRLYKSLTTPGLYRTVTKGAIRSGSWTAVQYTLKGAVDGFGNQVWMPSLKAVEGLLDRCAEHRELVKRNAQ